MRLLRDNAAIESGRIVFDGTDIAGLDEKAMNGYRWTKMAMVFQSAMNALNPVLSIEEQLVDAVLAHQNVSKGEARGIATEMLELVDINADRLSSFPHQLSGGDAPAHHDRHGAAAQTGSSHHGRTHHGPGCRRTAVHSCRKSRNCG